MMAESDSSDTAESTAGARAPTPELTNNEARSRYELVAKGKPAFAEYTRLSHALMLTHTEVPEELEGQGIGSTLVRGVLDDARAQELEVVVMCPFIAAFIRRHPEYLDVMSEVSRRQVTRG